MTKKDFTAIANILKNISDDVESVGLSHPPIIFIHIIINQLADYFETTNPRFDRDRFMSACTGEPRQ